MGNTGSSGPAGAPGLNGPSGFTGSTGSQGPPGNISYSYSNSLRPLSDLLMTYVVYTVLFDLGIDIIENFL